MPCLPNIRIGASLAIMSGIAVLLAGILINGQSIASANIRQAHTNTERRNDLALNGALVNGAVRGTRIAATVTGQASDLKSLEAQFVGHAGPARTMQAVLIRAAIADDRKEL